MAHEWHGTPTPRRPIDLAARRPVPTIAQRIQSIRARYQTPALPKMDAESLNDMWADLAALAAERQKAGHK